MAFGVCRDENKQRVLYEYRDGKNSKGIRAMLRAEILARILRRREIALVVCVLVQQDDCLA